MAWYDASDLANFTFSSGRVATWLDSSGNGRTATAATSLMLTCLPQLDGSKPPRRAVFFDVNVDNSLTSSASLADTTSSAFAVVALVSYADYRTIFAGSTGANQWVLNSAGRPEVYKAGVAALAAMGTGGVAAGVPFVVGQVISATQCVHYVNTTSETDGHGQTLTAGTLRIGSSQDTGASHRFYGWMSELVMYDSTLSTTDADATVGYLMTKWGVT